MRVKSIFLLLFAGLILAASTASVAEEQTGRPATADSTVPSFRRDVMPVFFGLAVTLGPATAPLGARMVSCFHCSATIPPGIIAGPSKRFPGVV